MTRFDRVKKWFRFRYLVIRQQLYYLFRKNTNPIFNNGIHFVEGLSGSGKTLLANYMLQESLKKNQFMYSNINQFDKEKTITIDFFSIFENGKQVKKLPIKYNNKFCAGLIIDELNASFNRRLNNRRDYNDAFVGLMQFSVTHRHQKINKIYYLGQSLELQDRQIQNIFRYMHKVKNTKRYNFEHFLETGKVDKLPKRLKIEHFIKSDIIDKSGTPVFIKFKTSKIKIDYDKHIKTYNHLGYHEQFNQLPNLVL